MGFLSNYGCVSTTVRKHHPDSNEMRREKATRKLDKNATCCFEQILEATLYKTAAVRPLTSYLTNDPNKKKKDVQDIAGELSCTRIFVG